MDARLRRVNKEITGMYALESEATVVGIDVMHGLALQIARTTRHLTFR